MHQEFKGKVLLLIALTLAFALALSAQTRQLDLSSSANQAVLKNNSDLVSRQASIVG
ncbi:MAG: hypothetical protein PHH32_03020 [Eubacteriales bacterium]|nr:hypothetical protein [Eubacteriales bacterium]